MRKLPSLSVAGASPPHFDFRSVVGGKATGGVERRRNINFSGALSRLCTASALHLYCHCDFLSSKGAEEGATLAWFWTQPDPTLRRQTQCMQHIFRDLGPSFADCTLRRLPLPYTTFIALLHTVSCTRQRRFALSHWSRADQHIGTRDLPRHSPPNRRPFVLDLELGAIVRTAVPKQLLPDSLKGQFRPCCPRQPACGQVCKVHSSSIITCGLTVTLTALSKPPTTLLWRDTART